eukprot:TRINITY_DN19012_c0_g1_i1.p1 TRINITY_DN19012_c0_g1~~TRINITY_DN19012_c0_g1_i1.p1  ORF type:complete len:219 (+),score=76.57 TRINITY_DN19012_c0_g1_i1:87-743(+)
MATNRAGGAADRPTLMGENRGGGKTVDAFDSSVEKCAGCHLEFEDGEKILEACGLDWHHSCFRCYNCAKEFTERDADGDLVYALQKMQDGKDRPMHAHCSQHYIDQHAKKTVKGSYSVEKVFDNHIGTCRKCAKEIKGNVKRIPKAEEVMTYHLTCFKCEKCGYSFRDNDTFHWIADGKPDQTAPHAQLWCQTCGGTDTGGEFRKPQTDQMHVKGTTA